MDEIPEWAIRDAEKSLKGIYPEMVSPQAFLYLRETIARTLVEQMERDAKIAESEADQNGFKIASAIRAAAEATRPGEGSGK